VSIATPRPWRRTTFTAPAARPIAASIALLTLRVVALCHASYAKRKMPWKDALFVLIPCVKIVFVTVNKVLLDYRSLALMLIIKPFLLINGMRRLTGICVNLLLPST
jgi:hypothetical protein